MPQPILLERLRALEQIVVYRELPPVGERPYRCERGDFPVLISAPHGAAHTRNGRFKPEDEYTTGLARLIAAETGAHVIYATYLNPADPNWDRESAYKLCLHKIVERHKIQFVLDLHGMRNAYKIGLAVGTMNGRSCPQQQPLIEQTLAQHRFRPITQEDAAAHEKLQWDTVVFNYSKFTGGLTSHTITRFASQTLGVPAAQVELCSAARIVERGPHGDWPFTYYGRPEAIMQAARGLIAVTERLGREG